MAILHRIERKAEQQIFSGVRHVFAENLRMSSPDMERAIRIKTNPVRGGKLDHLHLRYRDIEIGIIEHVTGAEIEDVTINGRPFKL